MAERIDRLVVRGYVLLHGGSILRYFGDAESYVNEIGREAVQTRLTQVAEGADRRLGYLLTAGGFIVAIAGFSVNAHSAEITVQSLASGLAGLLGSIGFLCALRGTTRIVDRQHVVRPLHKIDTSTAWRALEQKLCWSWASTRTLRIAIALLAIVFILNGLAL